MGLIVECVCCAVLKQNIFVPFCSTLVLTSLQIRQLQHFSKIHCKIFNWQMPSASGKYGIIAFLVKWTFSPRACGSGRTSLTSGSALGRWTSTVTNRCLEPGGEGTELPDMDFGGRGKDFGGGGGAGSGGGGGGKGERAGGLGPRLGDWTLGKGPMWCWVTAERWAIFMSSFLEGTRFLTAA